MGFVEAISHPLVLVCECRPLYMLDYRDVITRQ